MKRMISAHLTSFFCFFIIAGLSLDASAGIKAANFKVPARGTIKYTADVPSDAGSISITVKDMSQMVNLAVFKPGSKSESCSSSTWSSGMEKPLRCVFNNPEPGKWKIKVEGSVHVGNVDKYPHVTGQLIIRTQSGQTGLSGPGIQASTGQFGAGSRKVEKFKVSARGSRDYTVDVPANIKALRITVKDMSQMVNLAVFKPGSKSESCSSSTWSSGMEKPLRCVFNNPEPGKWKIKVEGSVHVGNVDRYPHVTGQLVVKMTGGQPDTATSGTSKSGVESPPGHPVVDAPEGAASQPAQVAEAGTWFASATTIEYDSHLKGYIKKGDYDMYQFYFPGGNLKAYSKGNLDLVADLLNSEQEQIGRDRNSGPGNNFKFKGNYPAGLYYIQIRVMYHGGEGPYELILGNGQNWAFLERM